MSEDRYPMIDLATGRKGTYIVTRSGTRLEWEPSDTGFASFVGLANGYHHLEYGCPVLRPHSHPINPDGSLDPTIVSDPEDPYKPS